MTYKIVTDSMDGKIDVINSKLEYDGKTYLGANFIIELNIDDKPKEDTSYVI